MEISDEEKAAQRIENQLLMIEHAVAALGSRGSELRRDRGDEAHIFTPEQLKRLMGAGTVMAGLCLDEYSALIEDVPEGFGQGSR